MDLLSCKKLHKELDRDFRNWSISGLLEEAIAEFKEKYAEVQTEP